MDYRLSMAVVFTDPPYAQVGATESELGKGEGSFIVSRARFPETGRAITMEVRHGLWKLLADRDSGELLGAAIVGPRADDLVHLVALMMAYRAKAEDIAGFPWYHPTLSEVMLDLGRRLTRQQAEPLASAGRAPILASDARFVFLSPGRPGVLR